MPFELIAQGTNFDFIGKRRVCIALSSLMLLAGLVAIPIQGVRLGIDFAGGTEMQVLFGNEQNVDEGDLRAVVTACGVADPSVVRYGELGAQEFLIRFLGKADEPPEDAEATCPLTDQDRASLAEAAKEQGTAGGGGEIVDRLTMALRNAIGSVDVLRVEFVGPRVGRELQEDGLSALALACILILIYIAFRFSTRFAPGAVVALVHDVGITAGLFVIFGLEFDLRVLAALLAILGYSLNDTIIIYDRIRENMTLRTKHDLVDVLNRSINQTLSRTVLTSGTTLAAVMCLLFLGGEVLRPFAIAMTLGIAVGTYSSIYIAAPTLLFLETRYGGGVAGTVRDEKPTRPAPEAQRKSRSGKSKARKRSKRAS